MAAPPPLRFRGCAHFRERLVLATLSGRRVVISDIRARDEAPGLRDFEAGFLRLLDTLTNGTRIEINETGTSLRFAPGLLIGGSHVHECGLARSVGWFLEGVLPLAPFGKKTLALTLRGITGDDVDFSVDSLRALHLPALTHFGVSAEGLALNVSRRGAPPGGGGEVIFTCPIVRELRACNLVDEGFVKRIRGTAFTCRVSPQVANRIVDGARGLLNHFIPDVYIATDHSRGIEGGLSPGYGAQLTAFSTSGCVYGSQRCTGAASGTSVASAAVMMGGVAGATPAQPPLLSPEDLGRAVAAALLDEIERGGCIAMGVQSLFFTLMALAPEDVSRARVGMLSPAGVNTLRLIRTFFGITFKLKPEARAVDGAAVAAAAAAEVAKETAAAAAVAAGGENDDDEEEGGGRVTRGKRKRDSGGVAAAVERPLVGAAAAVGGHSANTVLVSCLGTGFKNLAKRVT